MRPCVGHGAAAARCRERRVFRPRGCPGHLSSGRQRPHGLRSLLGPGSPGLPATAERSGRGAPAGSAGPARGTHNTGRAWGAASGSTGTSRPRWGAAEPAAPSRPAPNPRGPATPALRAGRLPSQGLTDNGTSTAGLVPGFLRRPATTRPLPGLAALSCRRSQAGRDAAEPAARGSGRTSTGATEAEHAGGEGGGRWGPGECEPDRPARPPPGAGTVSLTSRGGHCRGNWRSPAPPGQARRS